MSGTVGACWDLSRFSDIVGFLGCYVEFLFRLVGLGVVFLLPGVHGNGRLDKDIKSLFAQSEQGVWFEGEAVRGTCKEGVVGWGCSKCRGQRLKLAKFLFRRNLKKPVCDFLNNQPIASLQNRRGDRGGASEVVAEVSRRID